MIGQLLCVNYGLLETRVIKVCGYQQLTTNSHQRAVLSEERVVACSGPGDFGLIEGGLHCMEKGKPVRT